MTDLPIGVTFGRLVWSGTYGDSPEEIFAYGRWAYWDEGSDLEDVLDDVQNDVTNMLAESVSGTTAFPTLASVFPSDVAWTLLKIHAADVHSGSMIGESHMRELSDVGTGTETQGLPYQISLAITAQAAFPRRSKRTRFYLPRFVAGATNGHGRVLDDVVDTIQTQLKFEQTDHALTGTHLQFCTGPHPIDFPQQLDRLYSGNVIDTIRRRRNKLPEVRHILAL